MIDHGTIVQLLGQDQDGSRVVIAFDHRPFALFWSAWRAAGFPQPLTFDPNQNAVRFD